MTLGNTIAYYRKQLGLTQDALAQKLEVTNQAVSKWESDQCCPDIMLLPKIADIFEITLDELFGREARQEPTAEVPWEDDGVLRAVLYVGRKLVAGHKAAEKIEFCYEGSALNIQSEFSVSCDDVAGDVTAGGDVNCDSVAGHVSAGGNITCDDIEGNVQAGGNVTCDDVEGSVNAGLSVTCDTIEGNVNAGRDVTCDEINGSTIRAGGNVSCDHMEM